MPRLPSAADFGGPAAPRPSRAVTEHQAGTLDRTGALVSGLGDMVLKETDRLESLSAENALNKLRERRVELTLSPEKGFQRLQGGAVVEKPILDEFPAAFQGAIDEVGKGLSAGAQRKFQQRAAGELTGFRTDLLRHVAAQTDKFRSDVFNAAVSVESSYASAMWADPAAVEGSIQRVLELLPAEVERQGLTDPKMKQLFLQQSAGAIVTAAVQGALTGDDSATALRYFEQYGDKLTEQQRRQMHNAVRSATSWDAGQALGQQAYDMMLSGKSMTQIEKHLLSETRGAKDTYQNAKAVFNQMHGAFKENQRQAADAAQDRINRGEPWEKIRGQYLGSMDPSSVDAFDRRVKAERAGRNVQTDFSAWQEVSERILAGDDFDLNSYADRISTPDLKSLYDRKQKAGQPDSLRDVRTLEQQLGEAYGLLGYGNKPRDKERKGQLSLWVSQEIDRRQAELRRALTYGERQEVIQEGARVVGKNTLFGLEYGEVRRFEEAELVPEGVPPTPVAESAPKGALASLVRNPSPEAEALGMTVEERAAIIQEYRSRRAGALPSEAEILRIYRILTQRTE